MKLQIKKLHSDARLPEYALPGDAGMDLFALESVSLEPGARTDIGTGLAIAIPEGYVGLIWDKSGLSNRHGLKVLGGVIDSGYRGEIRVGLINLGSEPVSFESGHKVAQMLIQRVESPEIVEVEVLDETERGSGGFGSTGR
jgi:dUTP pyrophosphatase